MTQNCQVQIDHLKKLTIQLILPRFNQTLHQLRLQLRKLQLFLLKSQRPLLKLNQLPLKSKRRKLQRRKHQRKNLLNQMQPLLVNQVSRALMLPQRSLLGLPPRSVQFTEVEKLEPKLQRRELP